jgi:hypothetical protein
MTNVCSRYTSNFLGVRQTQASSLPATRTCTRGVRGISLIRVGGRSRTTGRERESSIHHTHRMLHTYLSWLAKQTHKKGVGTVNLQIGTGSMKQPTCDLQFGSERESRCA